MNVTIVDQTQIDMLWPLVKPFISQTDDRETKFSDVYQELISGNWKLWLGFEDDLTAVATTSFAQYPKGKVMRVETLAGDGMGRWLHRLKDMEDWAKLNGCIGMDIFGRKGFEKVLEDKGYEFEAVLLRKRFKLEGES